MKSRLIYILLLCLFFLSGQHCAFPEYQKKSCSYATAPIEISKGHNSTKLVNQLNPGQQLQDDTFITDDEVEVELPKKKEPICNSFLAYDFDLLLNCHPGYSKKNLTPSIHFYYAPNKNIFMRVIKI